MKKLVRVDLMVRILVPRCTSMANSVLAGSSIETQGSYAKLNINFKTFSRLNISIIMQ